MCELHFVENDILLFDETFLNDVNKIKRIRPILKAGAVPFIFPNLPFHLTEPKVCQGQLSQVATIWPRKSIFSSSQNVKT